MGRSLLEQKFSGLKDQIVAADLQLSGLWSIKTQTTGGWFRTYRAAGSSDKQEATVKICDEHVV